MVSIHSQQVKSSKYALLKQAIMGLKNRVVVGNLKIAKCLYDQVKFEVAPGSGVEADTF